MDLAQRRILPNNSEHFDRVQFAAEVECECGGGLSLPWREAGPPNHLNDKVDPDQ